MLNQLISITPQAAPAKSAAAETRKTSSSQSAQSTAVNKPEGDTSDSFGALLKRQMDEKNSMTDANPPAGAESTPPKKTSDTEAKQADQEKLAAPEDASTILAAMLSLAPEKKPNIAKLASDEQSVAAKTAIDQLALKADRSGKAISATADLKTGQTKVELLDLSAQKLERATSFKADELPATVTAASTNPAASALAAASQQTGSLTSPASNTANASIAAPLHSNVWPEEFSQKVSWISTQQNQTAELHLNPPDLGPIRIVLKLSDNQATALFSSPHGAVRDAIENALPKLREIMADNGIMLGNATVSDQSPRDGGAAGFMNQRANPRTDAAASGITTTETAALHTPVMAVRQHNGMVDTFA